MPNPLKRLHVGVGLWPRQHGIPLKLEYEVLCHLASDPEARAYLKPGYDYEVGVSNANGVPGWSRKGAVHGLRCGCHTNRSPWLIPDKEATKPGQKQQTYKITEAGFEAIAQYIARHRYEEAHLRLATRILAKSRKLANALKPK